MSFYSDASLVMIPSGYKTSKVYSAVPTDGTGDLSFTRTADTATRVGPDGLIEKVRTNLFTYSNTISDASWIKAATGITVTGGQAGYDGTNNAWLITKDAAAFKFVRKGLTTPTGVLTFSVYMKAGTLTTAALRLLSTPDVQVVFNLNTGEVISNLNALAVSSQSVGNGWFRYSISGNMTTLAEQIIYPDGVATTNAGNILIQDAMLEVGDVMTDYIATTTAAVSVGPVANVPRLDYLNSSCPRLLLEPQRTNIALFSEQFDNAAWSKSNASVTANSATSPDGYQNADTYLADGVSALHNIASNSLSLTSATAYSFSVFAKKGTNNFIQLIMSSVVGGMFANFDLNTGTVGTLGTVSGTNPTASIVDYGNGWYRCIINFTATTTTSAFANIAIVTSASAARAEANTLATSVFLWGAQVEAGAYATSYVPTLGAAVTRGADAATKTGISSLIGQTEGTLFAEYTATSSDTTNATRIINLRNSSNSNQVYIQQNTTNSFTAVAFNGSNIFIGTTATGFATAGTNYKLAFAYKDADFAFYINGSQVAVSSGTGLGTLSIDIVDLSSNVSKTNNISQALLFKTRLPNSSLAELTSL